MIVCTRCGVSGNGRCNCEKPTEETMIDTLDMFDMIDPITLKAKGYEYCSHCNGYGSSLKEDADKCTKCNGSGLMKIKK